MNFAKKTIVAMAAGTVGALVLAANANAAAETTVWASQTNVNAPSLQVSYADLNIKSEAGMATLERRIEQAAEEVCGSTDYRIAGSLDQARQNAQCQADAIDEARAQVPAGRVASLD